MTRERSNAISGTSAPFIGAKPSKQPVIGSHRGRLPIGGHRVQQILELQSLIGNQATRQWLNSSGERPEQEPQKPWKKIGIGAHRAKEPFAMVKNNEAKFDKKLVPQGRIRGVELNSRTLYANESQRAAYQRGFNRDGKMVNTADGQTMDTIGALESATKGSKANRHIFTMDGEGKFYSTDAVKENLDRAQDVRDRRKQDLKELQNDPEKQEKLRNMQLPSMERIHHSTFGAGADVAGAGELQVRDGQVELVSDASGHYKPGSKQMIQTVQQIVRNHVPLERLGVEFIGKPEFEYETDEATGRHRVDGTTGKKVHKLDADGNKVAKKDQYGLQSTSANMQASALELLAYADYAPEAAEERMRDMHGQKNAVLSELLYKTKKAKPIEYGSDRGKTQSNYAKLMKELLRKRPQADAISSSPEEKYFGTNPIEDLSQATTKAVGAYNTSNFQFDPDNQTDHAEESDESYDYNYNYGKDKGDDGEESKLSYNNSTLLTSDEGLSYNNSTLLTSGEGISYNNAANETNEPIPYSSSVPDQTQETISYNSGKAAKWDEDSDNYIENYNDNENYDPETYWAD